MFTKPCKRTRKNCCSPPDTMTPTPLRYVCISDLHLGAAYSSLTFSDSRGRPDPARCSDTLAALKDAKAKGQTIIAVVNVAESSIARDSRAACGSID